MMQAISAPLQRPLPKPLDVAKYDPFLADCPQIDATHPAIQDQAEILAFRLMDDEDITRACYEWVRDEVAHTGDVGEGPVTCKASDVLEHRTGFCFAKSHLLAALLRANGVPAGMTYQRLRADDGTRYVLHGLNVVHLPRLGWYRMDARGNTDGVDAQFTPPNEHLAWTGKEPGEINFDPVWATPMKEVVEMLETYDTVKDVQKNMIDIVQM
ncbi:transglutaminase family protein [Magnetovibrio sp. PR-2]|uniref:transglutaminase-like domain-containing protein n=1 Tax=Magnetovibrio sp. PR-2 TaxID=3120356 RepID=UPI002FCDEBBB